MNLRTKKTLSILLRGVAVLAFLTLFGVLRSGWHGLGPGFYVCVALNVAVTGYAWWWYGDSPKAVEARMKVEAKRAARQQTR
ncbi:hypothetical protein ACIRS1_07265 [Kitasatospora sp. NPDC101176]|uniref:hypothetical protein n=1 Tax=Kitasatospora sp. NPDC101176 TaxID=3364099 RepID=UPI0038235CB4